MIFGGDLGQALLARASEAARLLKPINMKMMVMVMMMVVVMVTVMVVVVVI